MADYQLSATFRLNDRGFTAGIRAAEKETSKLERGIGDLKNQKLMFQVGVEGMEKIKRYHDMMRRGGMKIPPLEISARDNATSKIQKIRQEITSLSSKAHTVAVNIKTNGMAALGKAKNSIDEMAGGAAMAAGAGVMGVAGIGFGAVDALNTYKDFDYQMKRNKALFTTGLDSAEAERQYKNLMAAARHYGSTMIFTAQEVAVAEEKMALAGWDADTSIKALPAILNAAVASGEDLGLVSDIITDDMTAMGYKAGTTIKNALGQDVEAAQHFSDVMLRTTLRSNTNFYELGLAMKYAAPLAHTLGYQIEDVAVAMGLMANNGIKADQAGTGLRGIMNRFISQPKKAAMAMEQLGVSMFDAAGNAKGLMPMLMDVRAALKGNNVDAMIDFAEQITGEKVERREELTEFLKERKARGGGKLSAEDQARLGQMLSGTYALAPFLAIMNSSDEDIQKLMTEIYQKSDGTGAEIQKEMMNTLSGDLKALQSAWEDFNIELFDGKGANGIRDFVQAATEDINAFKNSLKDGLDFGDVGKLGLNIVTQLKNKFLELDGIGSILAGGALMVGLRAILKTALKVKDTLSEWSKIKTVNDLGNQIRGNKNPSGGLSSVGTMNIKAGVVNLTGAINQNGGNNLGSRNVGNQSRVDDYYRRRETILAGQNSGGATPPASTASRFGGVLKSGLKVAGGGALLSLPFAAMDIFSAQSHSAETLAQADETVAYHKQYLENLKTQGAKDEQIQAQQEEVKAAEAFRQRTIEMNQKVERQANFKAAGTVAGTAIGAVVGSAIPVVGTMIGGMAGGVLGDLAGSKLADFHTAKEKSDKENERHENERKARRGLVEGAKTKSDYDRLDTKATQNNWKSTADTTQKNLSAKNNSDSKFGEINRKGIDDGLKSLKDWWGNLFKAEKPPAQQGTDYQKNFQQVTPQNYTPLQNNITPQKISPPTLPKFELPEFNFGEKIEGIKTSLSGLFTDFELPSISEFFSSFELPELNLGAKIQNEFDFVSNTVSTKIEGIKTSLSGLFTDFELPNISEFFSSFELPELNFGEKIQNEIYGIGEIDFASILPNFSGIGATIDEQLNVIPEKISEITTSIGEGFSEIPTAASEAFTTISTYASEGLATIQSAWGALPGFFGGLFSGLGGVASGAGAAIAAGINSGIGMIQSAWEGLSGWLSAKIASLSAMASSAAAAIGIGGIGHNAKGTSNFAGGWSEINESGGELILLPSGAKIYPHSTTKNILQHEFKNNLSVMSGFASDGGETQKLMEEILSRRINSQRDDVFKNIRTSNTLNNLQNSAVFNQSPFELLQNNLGSISKADIPNLQEKNFDSLGNIEGLEIPEFNRITADDDLMVAAAKRQAQLEQLSSMQSPFNFDFDSLEIPSFEIPQATQSNTTTNNSPTNNFNFGGVNISNGMNFDEFVHRLQELFSGAVNNSELV